MFIILCYKVISAIEKRKTCNRLRGLGVPGAEELPASVFVHSASLCVQCSASLRMVQAGIWLKSVQGTEQSYEKCPKAGAEGASVSGEKPVSQGDGAVEMRWEMKSENGEGTGEGPAGPDRI